MWIGLFFYLILLSSSHPLYPKFYKIVFSTTYDILWFYSNYYVCWLVFLFKEFPRRREEGRVKIRQWLRWEQNRDFPTTPSFTPVASSLSHNFIIITLILFHLYLYPTTSFLPSVQIHHLSSGFIFIQQLYHCHPIMFPTTPSFTPVGFFYHTTLSSVYSSLKTRHQPPCSISSGCYWQS